MARFGKRSKERLATCHPDLQKVLNEAIKYYDFTVLEGHRNRTSQMQAYYSGRSKVQWPNSKHNTNPSLAVDIAPWPVDWSDRNRFYFMIGLVLGIASQMGVELRSGADWDRDGDFKNNRFDDLPHIELYGDKYK